LLTAFRFLSLPMYLNPSTNGNIVLTIEVRVGFLIMRPSCVLPEFLV